MDNYGALIARNIKRFRRDLNLSQKELSARSGVPFATVRRLENAGFNNGDMRALTELSFVLERSIFDMARAPRQLSSVRFRANKSLSDRARERIVDACAGRLSAYCFIENLLDVGTSFSWGVPNRAAPGFSVQSQANAARLRAGLSSSAPVGNLNDVLTSCGVKFWFYPRRPNDKIFGLAIHETPSQTAVVVFDDERTSAERLIFSAFHELGHLVLHSDAPGDPAQEEKEADLFAGCFLMPPVEFARRWDATLGLSFVDRVLFVKRFFRVSYMTVLKRLVDSGREQSTVYAKFRALYCKSRKRTLARYEEPESVGKIDLSNDRFRSLVFQALKDDRIGYSKAAELLDCAVTDIYPPKEEDF